MSNSHQQTQNPILLLAGTNYSLLDKRLIKLFGLKGAVFLSELYDQYEQHRVDGSLIQDKYFVETREMIQQNTSLSFSVQTSISNELKQHNVIDVVKRGLPASNYYCINFEQLSEYINSLPKEETDFDYNNQIKGGNYL